MYDDVTQIPLLGDEELNVAMQRYYEDHPSAFQWSLWQQVRVLILLTLIRDNSILVAVAAGVCARERKRLEWECVGGVWGLQCQNRPITVSKESYLYAYGCGICSVWGV